MQSRMHCGILLFVAALHVLLDIAIVAFRSAFAPEENLFGVLSAVFAQATLLGVFAGLAPLSTVWRVIGAAGGAVWFFSIVWIALDKPSAADVLLIIIFTQVPLLTVWFIAWLLRFRGLRLTKSFLTRAITQRRQQFTLTQLLVVILLVAGLSAGARFSRSHLDTVDNTPATVVAVFAMLVILIFVTQLLAIVWATLAPGRVWWRLPILYSWIMATASLFCFAVQMPSTEYPLAIWLGTVQFVLAAGSLLIVRAIGYRLLMRPPDLFQPDVSAVVDAG